MIKISKHKFNKIFEVIPIKFSLNSEFKELVKTLMDKTNLDFFDILDLIKNWDKK